MKYNDETHIQQTLSSFFEKFRKALYEISLEDSAVFLEEFKRTKNELEENLKAEKEIEASLGDDTLKLIWGLNLTHDSFLNQSKLTYKIDYEKLNSNGEEEKLQNEIKELKRKIKFFPFGKDHNRALLSKAEKNYL